MKFFKRAILMFLIISISLICLGCGGTKKVSYKIIGKKLAQKYIKDKYRFEGEIVGVSLGTKDYAVNFWTTYSGKVFVKIKHNDREFTVYTDAENKKGPCYDNYQLPEIKAAVKSIITNHAGKEPAGFSFYYGELLGTIDEDNGLINDYYDGNNLDELFKKDITRIMSIVEFTGDIDLNIFNNLRLSDTSDEKLLFVNYKDSDALKKTSTHTYFILEKSQSHYLYENSAYIKGAKFIDNGTVKDYSLDNEAENHW